MAKYVLVLLSYGFFGWFNHCNATDLDSLLFKAYGAETDSASAKLFSEAKGLLVDKESKARFLYFKYYYHYKQHNQDSIDYYEELVMPMFTDLEDWQSYFQLANNRYYFLEEAGYSEKAIQYSKEILKLAEAKGSHEYVSKFYAHIGNSYHNISFYEKGVSAAKKGYYYALDHVPEDDLVTSLALNIIAINFDDWNKPDSALYYHRKVLALKNLDETYKTSTYNNIGNTYLKLNNLDSADLYISKSLDLALELNDPYHLSTAYNNKADVLLRKENLVHSRQLLDSTLKYAELSGAIEKLRDVHETHHRFYSAVDSSSLALEHLALYHAYKDSMVNSEKLQVIENIEKSELELEAEKALNKRNLLIVISTAIVIILGFILRQVILKRKKLEKEAKLQMQEERLRISRDLHDNIGAELSYMSSLIDQKLYTEENQEKRAELTELGESSRSAMTQLRETIWAIQTEDITLGKFKSKLEQLSRRYSENLDISIVVSMSGEDHVLDPVKAINLFRICQEAINNAFKYAKCKLVTVSINGLPNAIELKVSDKGKGFNISEITHGYGLNNMTERAAQMNGVLEIKSKIDYGTEVKLNVLL